MSPSAAGAPLPRESLDGLLGFAVTDEQWACICSPLEPYVIVAGAGTGKTTVMAARVLWLVASGLVGAHEVLGLTFTNKAAAELAHKVGALLAAWRAEHPGDPAESGPEPTIGTYHAFARRLIDEQGLRVGIEPASRLLTEGGVAQLAYRVVCSASGMTAIRTGPARLAADVLALDAHLAEQVITTDQLRAHDAAVLAEVAALPEPTKRVVEVAETAARRIELAHLVDELRDARRRVGGIDFTDHMRLCVSLVLSAPELVADLRATYRVILLDEYQDTSIAQRIILSTLFRGAAVTAVGDPLQAIYGWRSASVANIETFPEHFGAGRDAVRVLSLNRRSGVPILSAANRIAEQLRQSHPHVAALRPPQPRPARVRAALLETVLDERSWMADQVAAMVRSGRPPEQIAVLTRANDSLRPLQAELLARGIPASVSGTAALAASPYATAVLATLRLLHDPADNTAAVALLAGPRWRIGAHDLDVLGRRAARLAAGEGQPEVPDPAAPLDLRLRMAGATAVPDAVERPSLLEAAADPGLGLSQEALNRLREFLDEITLLQAHVGEPLPELVGRVVAMTAAQVQADLEAGATGVGDVGLAGLLRLVDGFADAEGRTGLGAFLAHLDASEQLDAEEEVDLPTVPGTVQLMTMHKAKGLEFPVVVLPHLSADVFPARLGSPRWTTVPRVVPSELRDDRHVLPRLAALSTKGLDAFVAECRAHDRAGDDRLAYVAVTRARDVVVASGHWWGPTQKTMRGPSPYLAALRAEAEAQGWNGDPDRGEPDPWEPEPQADDLGTAPSNPLLESVSEVPWPPAGADRPEVASAARAVARLLADATRPGRGAPARSEDGPGVTAAPASPAVLAEIAAWDAAIDALLDRTGHDDEPATVRVPAVLSASAAMDLAKDPGQFAAGLLRPMPRRRNRHADLGTAFHAWVEARLGLQPLLTDDDLPGAADEGIATAEELERLKQAFERLPYASRSPTGLEVPFSLPVGGRLLRGRIDAVFPAGPDAPEGVRWQVVDWKTSSREVADPLQLAIYRLAWAELAGVPVDSVDAAFVFVPTGAIRRPTGLPDLAQLAAILAGDDA